ncbi:MAG: hypothetical protein KF752_02445 [Pirellulaceae bacterium]|nr:hypothetical protein [Pirellulaceae bacterium]
MGRTLSHSQQLDDLIALFYVDPALLGQFQSITADQCPTVYRRLLAHTGHMTLTVEQHHGQPVDVQVLADRQLGSTYQRQILLRRRSDQRVVQFGIVSLALDSLSEQVQAAITSKQIPLGRILIQHDVLRQVHLSDLWRVECGDELAAYFAVPAGSVTFGRTAQIAVGTTPAVQLLEIVAPETDH